MVFRVVVRVDSSTWDGEREIPDEEADFEGKALELWKG